MSRYDTIHIFVIIVVSLSFEFSFKYLNKKLFMKNTETFEKAEIFILNDVLPVK